MGKLWTEKNFISTTLLQTITKIWNPRGGLAANEIGKNLFLFNFKTRKDLQKVLEGEPWFFDKQILVKEISGEEQPSEIELHCTPTWVWAYDLPINYRCEVMAKMMATKMGELEQLDNNSLRGNNKFLRFGV